MQYSEKVNIIPWLMLINGVCVQYVASGGYATGQH